MLIVGLYSLKSAQVVLESRFSQELAEVHAMIAAVDSETVLARSSRQRLKSLNQMIRQTFIARQWQSQTLFCEYSLQHYTQELRDHPASKSSTRELDFVKNKLGVDILFKNLKPAVYDICAEMTIFNNQGLIEAGIGIVPVQSFARTLSPKVAFFEQFVWDLQHRGVSDIDIPVLILGVAA